MSRRGAGLLVIVAIATLGAGCAPDPVETTAPPAAEPTPTPTPTPTAEQPVAVRQDTAFPLTCDEIDLSAIEAKLGRSLPLLPSPFSAFGEASTEQFGTRYCRWGAEGTSPYIIFSGSTHPNPDESAHAAECSSDSNTCAGTVITDGMSAYGYLQPPKGDNANSRFGAAWKALLAEITAELSARGRPADWVQPADALPAIFDCSSLESLDMNGAVGARTLAVHDTTGFDEGQEEPLPRDYVALGGHTTCTWYGDGQFYVTLNVLSGGGWFPDAGFANGESAEFDGVDRAFRDCVGNPPCSYSAVIGVDAVSVSVGSQYGPTDMTEADAHAAAQLVFTALAS